MTIFELTHGSLRRAEPVTFSALGITERGDLQRLLRAQIGTISPDAFVVTEEFGQWQDSSRRIDLLALDRDANLVVIELKRTGDGGHMELQALRYAAMVAPMTFAQVVEAHDKFRADNGIEGDAADAILAFLSWAEPDDERFGNDVRIVLASEDFSKEITTTVIWLNNHGLDVRCVRMKPHRLGEQVLLDVQQIIPLPEASDYQVRVREKAEVARAARSGGKWDSARFMAAVETTKGAAARSTAESFLHWSEAMVGTVRWGEGTTIGSFTAALIVDNTPHYLFGIYSDASLEVYFQWLAYRPPFSDPALRDELRCRLNLVPGVAIPADAITRRPGIPLALLASERPRRLLKDAFEWAVQTIRDHSLDPGEAVADDTSQTDGGVQLRDTTSP